MANIKSQMKRNRQTIVRNERNKVVRTTLKTHLKRFGAAAEAGDKDAAQAAYTAAARKLDKAAQKGVVHRNYAANRKSAMSKRLSAL